MDPIIERFPKATTTRAQAEQVVADHLHNGALACSLSETATEWVVSITFPEPAMDDAPSIAAVAGAAAAGAAAGAMVAGPAGAAVGAMAATGAVLASAQGGINFNSPAIPAGRTAIARQIADAFAAAGFNTVQQAAALANAIAESGLRPDAAAVTAQESSFGLFQLNTKGGLGVGHSPEELKDPAVNIAIIIAAAKRTASFRAATTLASAVGAFVRDIERPANADAAVAKRLGIANALFK